MIPRAFWLIFFYDLTIQGWQGVGRGLVPAAHADFAGATLMTMDVTKKNGFDATDGTLYLGFKSATEIEAGVPFVFGGIFLYAYEEKCVIKFV